MSHFSFCVAPQKHILFKEYCPKQIIQFNLQMTLHQLWVHWPVFFLSANTLGCQNSARDAVFLLLFVAKVGRCMAGRHTGEMCDQSCFCCPDSLICSTPHHVPPSLHMEPPAEQMPWRSSPGELVPPSFLWTAWKLAEWQFLSWDLLELASLAAQLCPGWEVADPLGHVRNGGKNFMWKLVWKESLCQSALLVPAKDLWQRKMSSIWEKSFYSVLYLHCKSHSIHIVSSWFWSRWAAVIFTRSSCFNYLTFWFEFGVFLEL